MHSQLHVARLVRLEGPHWVLSLFKDELRAEVGQQAEEAGTVGVRLASPSPVRLSAANWKLVPYFEHFTFELD